MLAANFMFNDPRVAAADWTGVDAMGGSRACETASMSFEQGGLRLD